jgi:IS5 family transposase
MAADQGADFEQYRRPTRRDVFLATMEKIVPWSQLCEELESELVYGGFEAGG